MRAHLGLGFSQTLNITPQLLQSIRLLQLTSAELEIHVREALERNPLLEGPELSSSAGEDNPAPANDEPGEIELTEVFHGTFAAPDDDDEGGIEARTASPEAQVRQFVLQQMAFSLRDEAEMRAAAWLVDQVDDAGYLEHSPQSLGELLPDSIAVSAARLEEIRQVMLRCDPVGFGAADLRECLLTQLSAIECRSPGHTLAMRTVLNHLSLLAEHDHAGLARALGTDLESVYQVESIILSLNPRPGERHAEATQYVLPDVVVKRERSGWRVELNAAVAPKIRVNKLYEGMLSRSDNAASARSMRDLLQEARWLVRALAMRHDTLLKVARTIVARQHAFLEKGAEAMQPLTLREVADAIGMHESTVSRITTGKYMLTPRGTYELKFFFSNRLQGAEVSSHAIRAMVKRLIDGENPDTPLADDTIAALLERQGVRIARRTVAKYRELLHIASAKERRRAAVPQPADASLAAFA